MLKRAFSHCKTGLHSRSCIVVGAQWGDEGKGKLVDILAKDYDIVGRFNGGANAGHTIEAYGKKFPFHLIPCGMLYEKVNNVLGNGVVVQIPTLFEELAEVENAGINTKGRLLISDRAHIVTSAHIAADGSHEAALGSSQIGTTKRGIGPTYCTKALRMGLRMGDLRHWDRFKLIYNNLVDFLEHAFKIHVDRQAELDQIQSFLPRLLPMITDTGLYVNQSLDSGKRILCEGANALMLDLDFGTYPYVTSSSTGVAGVASGLGLAPGKIESTIGVVKAYTTRVGSGPFPTEDTGDVGNHLQEKGREWGVTTGRRRRCGWLDLAVLKYTHMLNNYSSINITKLDILDEVHPIKVGVSYKIDGKEVMMPSFIDDLAKVQVEYETLPGWKSDTSHVENWNDLPENAKKYLEFIENKLGIPVTWVGVGPKRESMLQNPRFS